MGQAQGGSLDGDVDPPDTSPKEGVRKRASNAARKIADGTDAGEDMLGVERPDGFIRPKLAP